MGRVEDSARGCVISLEQLEARVLLAASVSVRAVADAHVRNGSYAATNYGTTTGLNVRNHATLASVYEGFLKFDMSAVSGTLESAVLKLVPSTIGADLKSTGSFRIRMLGDSADGWVEGNGGTNNNPVNEVRWNNKPAGTGSPLLVSGAPLVVNQALSIDVTTLVAQSLNANKIASFHLDIPTASATNFAYFYSDEHGTAAYRPVLVVTTVSPPPTAAISDVSLTEGNAGSSTATFNVTLSSAPAGAVTMSYATANGTAIAGSDYTAASGTVSFAAGETTKTISVSVLGDTTDEITETFVVNLSSPVGATIADAQGLGTIIDNDDPSASINDITVTEGNSGTSTATFTVTLSNAPVGAVTINYATADSTAASGSDYTAASGTVSFAAGELSKTISVSVLGDTTDESNESFLINLSGAVAAIILDAQGVGTITDDDAAPPPSGGKRIVGYFPSWGVYQRDYQISDVAAGKLTHLNYGFANVGSNLQIAIGDAQVDPSNFAALQTLKQQHPHLQSLISVGGWTWSEHFSDVALTAASRQTFATSAVNFMTQYGFDGIDIDWEFPVSGGESDNVNRPEDKHNYTLLMQELKSQLNALEAQNGRDYWLSIAAPAGPWTMQNLELAPLAATLDWINLMAYDLAGSWDPITGHNAALYDQTSNPADNRLNWNSAVDAYLAAGVPTSQLVVGAPFYGHVFGGVSSTNNGLYQADSTQIAGTFGETGYLAYWDIQARYLAPGSGYTRHWDAQGQVPYLYSPSTQQFVTYDDPESIGLKADYINNRDLGGMMFWELSNDAFDHSLLTTIHDRLGGPPGPPTIAVSNGSVIEGNSGTSTLTFTVSLSRAPAAGESVSIQYATANGTATVGSDYTAASGTLTFGVGESSKPVSITVLAEALQEANETLLLNLSNPTGGTISDAQGLGTIVDDDTPIAAVVDFNITDDWGTGHGATALITNSTPQAINAWRLEFDYAGDITGIWDAVIISHVGTRYVIGGAAWNLNIAAGGSVSFGFNATGPGAVMLNATLNGLSVSVI